MTGYQRRIRRAITWPLQQHNKHKIKNCERNRIGMASSHLRVIKKTNTQSLGYNWALGALPGWLDLVFCTQNENNYRQNHPACTSGKLGEWFRGPPRLFTVTVLVSSISSYTFDSTDRHWFLAGGSSMFSTCSGSVSAALPWFLAKLGNTLPLFSSTSVVSWEDFLWQQVLQLVKIESRIVEVENTPIRVQEINSCTSLAFSLWSERFESLIFWFGAAPWLFYHFKNY